MPLLQTIEKLKTKKEIAVMIEESVKKEVERQIFTKLEVIKGKDGESITGDKGEQGIQGLKGDNGLNGKDGQNGIDGKNGINGKDGQNGKDGSSDTAKQIADKLNTLKEVIDISVIKGLKNIDIEQEKEGIMAHISGLIGTRRNVAKLVREKPETPRGTIDGSNKTFYLNRIPFGGFLILVVNGAQQKKDEDFTISGAEIIYTTALQIGSNHQAIYF